MNTSGLLKKLLSSNADDVASRLSSKYVDDAARAANNISNFKSPKEYAIVSSNKPQRISLNDLTPIETGDKSVDWIFDQSKANPIIVDQHGRILDGHHRFYAAKDAFDADMAKYNSGNVPADFLEKRWGNTDFGDINAVVVNKEGFGNGWAEAMPVKNSTKSYQELYDLYNDYAKNTNHAGEFIGDTQDIDRILQKTNSIPSRQHIMEIVDHAVQNGTLDDVYKAAADMPVLARTTHTRPASGGGYSPVGVQRLRDLNELNFGYGGRGQREQMLLDPEMLNQGRLSGISKNLDDIGDVPQLAFMDRISAKNPGRSLPDIQEMALREVMPEEFHIPINSREDLQKAIYGNALGDLDTHHYAELNSNIRPQDVASVRSLPKGGMPKDNTFLDDIAQRLYATKGNPKATRDLINKYMLAFGGAIPAGGVLAGLMGGNDDQSMV